MGVQRLRQRIGAGRFARAQLGLHLSRAAACRALPKPKKGRGTGAAAAPLPVRGGILDVASVLVSTLRSTRPSRAAAWLTSLDAALLLSSAATQALGASAAPTAGPSGAGAGTGAPTRAPPSRTDSDAARSPLSADDASAVAAGIGAVHDAIAAEVAERVCNLAAATRHQIGVECKFYVVFDNYGPGDADDSDPPPRAAAGERNERAAAELRKALGHLRAGAWREGELEPGTMPGHDVPQLE